MFSAAQKSGALHVPALLKEQLHRPEV